MTTTKTGRPRTARRTRELLDVEYLGGGRLRALRPPPSGDPWAGWRQAVDAAVRSAGLTGRPVVEYFARKPSPTWLRGRQTGWQSPDRRAGWRLDHEPGPKGLHVNWWRVESDVLVHGAIRIPGGDALMRNTLLRRFFPHSGLELQEETGGGSGGSGGSGGAGRRPDFGALLSRVEQVALRLPPARRVPYLTGWYRRFAQLSGGAWTAKPFRTGDGSTVFIGRVAVNAQAVDPQGGIWRLDASDPAQFAYSTGPNYAHPRVRRVVPR